MMLITVTKIALVAAIISAVTVGITLTVIFFAGPLTDEDILCRSNVELTLEGEYDEGQVALNWTDSSYSSCSITYYLTIIVNDEIVLNNTDLGDTTTYIYPNIGLCSTFHASLYGVSAYGAESDVAHKRIDTDITEINELSITNQQASWTVSSNSDACSYRVEKDGAVIAESITSKTYDLSVEGLEACNLYELTVIPLHINGTSGTSKSENFDIGPPIITSYSIVGTILEWESSSDSENCEFLIELDSGEIGRTKERSYNFDAIDNLTPCTQHSVTITPIGISGDTGVPYDLPDFEIFAIINDLKLDGTLITWTTPNRGECEFEIRINDDPATYTKELEVDLSTYSLDVCVTTTFYINTVNSAGIADAVEDLSFELLPEISNLILTEYILSWEVSVTSNECQFQIAVDGNPVATTAQINIDLSSNYDLLLCTSYEISVTPVSPTYGNTGTTLMNPIKMFAKILTPVVGNTEITWEYSPRLDVCSFLIIFNNDEEHPVSITSSSYDISDMDKCQEHTGTIFVVDPSGNRGVQEEIPSFEILPEIMTVDFEESTMVFSWTASDDSVECKFELQVNDGDVNPDDPRSYSGVGDLDLNFCEEHMFKVRPIYQAGGTIFDWTNEPFELPIEQIQGFEMNNNAEEVTAEWSSRFKQCDVIVEVDGETYSSQGVTSAILTHDFKYCVVYSIIATAQDSQGNSNGYATDSFSLELTDDRAKESIGIEDRGDFVTLQPSDVLSECEITTMILPTYEDNVENGVTLYCFEYRILVRILDDSGTEVNSFSIDYTRKPLNNFQAISQLQVSLNTDGLVTVTLTTENFDDCVLNYLGNCEVNAAISEATDEIDVDATKTLEFETCPITDIGIFSMAIRPQYSVDDPTVDGQTISCTYDIIDDGAGGLLLDYQSGVSDICANSLVTSSSIK